MYEHIDSWKKSKSTFEQQLQRNIYELKDNYPPHWKNFISVVKNSPNVKRVVDIGCGVGVYCKLCEELKVDYIGYDYSKDAVHFSENP